ncbi:hypothetical protein QE152_g4515 [Popillia japonica]|uniref:Uncharacterized protein n=1 Tax=Popillia japonica TaxID=7064 RepID=A0AAW1MY95_POPJA
MTLTATGELEFLLPRFPLAVKARRYHSGPGMEEKKQKFPKKTNAYVEGDESAQKIKIAEKIKKCPKVFEDLTEAE